MKHFDKYVDIAAVFLLVVMITVNLDVFTRYFSLSVPEFREVSMILTVWVIILPIPYITATNQHIRIDFFYKKLSGSLQDRIDSINLIIGFITFVMVFYSGWLALEAFTDQETTFLGLSMAIVYFPLFYIGLITALGILEKRLCLRSRIISIWSD